MLGTAWPTVSSPQSKRGAFIGRPSSIYLPSGQVTGNLHLTSLFLGGSLAVRLIGTRELVAFLQCGGVFLIVGIASLVGLPTCIGGAFLLLIIARVGRAFLSLARGSIGAGIGSAFLGLALRGVVPGVGSVFLHLALRGVITGVGSVFLGLALRGVGACVGGIFLRLALRVVVACLGSIFLRLAWRGVVLRILVLLCLLDARLLARCVGNLVTLLERRVCILAFFLAFRRFRLVGLVGSLAGGFVGRSGLLIRLRGRILRALRLVLVICGPRNPVHCYRHCTGGKYSEKPVHVISWQVVIDK